MSAATTGNGYRFALSSHPTATSVCIAGAFNQWQFEAGPLDFPGVGKWWQEMTLVPGIYEYASWWMSDPPVSETASNPFGGRNSILKVAGSSPAAPLANAGNSPLKNKQKQKHEQRNTSK